MTSYGGLPPIYRILLVQGNAGGGIQCSSLLSVFVQTTRNYNSIDYRGWNETRGICTWWVVVVQFGVPEMNWQVCCSELSFCFCLKTFETFFTLRKKNPRWGLQALRGGIVCVQGSDDIRGVNIILEWIMWLCYQPLQTPFYIKMEINVLPYPVCQANIFGKSSGGGIRGYIIVPTLHRFCNWGAQVVTQTQRSTHRTPSC